MNKKSIVKALSAAGLASAVFSTPTLAAPLATDFVFMIDATSSMGGEIAGVRNGFSSFVAGLNSATVDARFAIVIFGGSPELILDFTSDAAATQAKLNGIAIGAAPGIHANHNLNPEAGLEAIRMVLGAAPDSVLATPNIPEDGLLNFRAGVRKNLILVTDEDSDRASRVANQFASQTSTEPPSALNAAWQAEVDATASAVIANRAYLNMLINVGDAPSRSQYGDYTKDVSGPDLLGFDRPATLAALLADTLTAESLQAQVLGAGLVARAFNVAGANDANFVNNFFAAKIEEVVTDPGDPTGAVPEPSILGLLGLGLFVLAASRRKTK